MEFILAKKQDAERVYELVQETIKAVYPKYYLQEIVDMFCEFHNCENIKQDIADENVYLLLAEGELIGTGTKKGNHITRVYVLPKFQNKGYGTFIMNRLEEMISEKYNCVDIDASLPACRLYANLGYRTIDHGIWECQNNVIQIYEIMRKDLDTMKLRPYKTKDAETILSWIKDERTFRKWSSDRYDKYPISAEDINHKYIDCNGDCEESDNFYPLIAVCDGEVVGHLILRYTDALQKVLRIGFVIVDDSKRGKGYGKRMVQMAIKYAKEMLQAEKITIGVFDNNESAYRCYLAAGFKVVEGEEYVCELLGEKWKCIEMEMML